MDGNLAWHDTAASKAGTTTSPSSFIASRNNATDQQSLVRQSNAGKHRKSSRQAVDAVDTPI